ncbi:MAG: DNA polymerase III subunit [Anaerolineae bacterium]|nr:DNA polymerase III subunit [Anaerolineae bacterium]
MDGMHYSSRWRVIGHEWAIEHLTRSLNANRLRHAYLITGAAGIGKTTFAWALAQAVSCLADEGRPCGVCRACTLVAHNNYADFNLIESDASRLKIEQIRDMQRVLALRPVEGRYRVVLLRRFHEATPQAMDSLLKTLEEPPPYVLLLLTADATESLLPTIRSRCQPIRLRPLPTPVVRHALEAQFGADPERAALLAQLSGGRMGWAVRALQDESLLDRRNEWIEKLENALGMTRAGRFALAEALSRDKSALEPLLDLWQSYWRDAMLLGYSATTPITNRDRQNSLGQIARSISVDEAHHALTAIRRTQRYLKQNVNPRLALDVLMLDMPRVRVYPAPPGPGD